MTCVREPATVARLPISGPPVVRAFTPAGASPTLNSLSFTSLGNPTIILFSYGTSRAWQTQAGGRRYLRNNLAGRIYLGALELARIIHINSLPL
jgi:hypothetical protein